MIYRASCRLIGSRVDGMVLVRAPNQELAKKLVQEAVFNDPEIREAASIFSSNDVVVDTIKPLSSLDQEEMEDVADEIVGDQAYLYGWGT